MEQGDTDGKKTRSGRARVYPADNFLSSEEATAFVTRLRKLTQSDFYGHIFKRVITFWLVFAIGTMWELKARVGSGSSLDLLDFIMPDIEVEKYR